MTRITRKIVAYALLAGAVAVAHTVPIALADAPAGQYSLTAETVKDRKTGLMWQRKHDSQAYTWEAAKTRCSQLGEGWRLPTLRELLSLVDPTRAEPAIDVTAFPDTPGSAFWTASPASGVTDRTWYVYFDTGRSDYGYDTSHAFLARCVRWDGQE